MQYRVQYTFASVGLCVVVLGSSPTMSVKVDLFDINSSITFSDSETPFAYLTCIPAYLVSNTEESSKSTLFNALTQTIQAQAANFPFCTIEPNTGRVAVPDNRLQELAKIVNPQNIIPTQLEFVDIAGLVKGASKGEGLGNQFLANIRETDAIIHVLRCFEDDNITHVEGSVDPIRDAEIVETELMIADLESLEKRFEQTKKKAQTGGDKEAALKIAEEFHTKPREEGTIAQITALKFGKDK